MCIQTILIVLTRHNRIVQFLNNWYPKVTDFHVDIMWIHRKTNEIIAITSNHIFRHARKFLIDYRLVFDSVDLVVWYFYTIFTHLVWNEHFESLSMFKLIVFSFDDIFRGNGRISMYCFKTKCFSFVVVIFLNKNFWEKNCLKKRVTYFKITNIFQNNKLHSRHDLYELHLEQLHWYIQVDDRMLEIK